MILILQQHYFKSEINDSSISIEIIDQDVTFVLIVAIIILLVQKLVETIEISLLRTVQIIPPGQA